MKLTYGQRVKECAELVGGQTKLARDLTRRYPDDEPVSQQRIHYIIKSDATGSPLTVHIAEVTGRNPVWLATGRGRKTVGPPLDGKPRQFDAKGEQIKIGDDLILVREAPVKKEKIVKLSRNAITIAEAWESLSESKRQEHFRRIMADALRPPKTSARKAKVKV